MSVIGVDIEVARNLFFVGVSRFSDDRQVRFEMSERAGRLDHARLRKVLTANTSVGYNFAAYDAPLIWYALHLMKKYPDAPALKLCAAIKNKSDAIIAARARYWEVEKITDVRIPRDHDFIDLMETCPAPPSKDGTGEQRKPSLKTLNGRLHGARMQDLPFEHDAWLSDEMIDKTIDYCMNADLPATKRLWESLREPLEMRRIIGEDLGRDLRSKSDTQVGLAIITNRAEQRLRRKVTKVPVRPGTTFPYKPPAYIKFETPVLRQMLERVCEHQFVVKDTGKVDLPDFLLEPVVVGSTQYAMGIGGLHSTESNRAVHSDEDHALIDADVGGYYPAIILTTDMYPPAIGKDFIPIFQSIYDDRIAAKRAKDKVRDKGLKISLNGGGFGNLGNRYSIVYAPHLLIAVTLTGQLALLMLIERAERAGIQVVSANTDGVVFRCPREKFDGVDGIKLKPSALAEITNQWEIDTGFDLEFVEYEAIYNQSVNSYFALKKDGGHKRKGPIANPWSPHPDDFDPRGQLMKNPQATICSDAALALIKHGTPIEDTIYGCTDIRQFVTVIKADGGATWRGDYLGKVVRYYWSTDGDPIFKAKAHAKTGNHPMVPKTEGCAPCMTLPDELPDDLDYDRYIRVTKEILMDLGYMDRPPPPPKLVRLTKANTIPILLLWAMAD